MKIDVGTGMVLVLGVPNFLTACWFWFLWGKGDCLRILPYGAHSAPICGGGLFFLGAVPFVFFALVGGVAWMWRN
jgi:hypothetical protein